MNDPRLQIRALTKNLGGHAVLAGVSLTAYAGEVHAICGESGAGKSALVRILTGLDVDFEGTIALDGSPVRFASPREAEGAGVRAVFQEPELVPELSVAANIGLGHEPARYGLVRPLAMAERARALLDRLGVPLRPRARVGSLRAEERQLVAIARALAFPARVLVLDEPAEVLGGMALARLFRVIGELCGEGVAVLYGTARVDEITNLADRVSVLRDGRLTATVALADTTPRQVARWMAGSQGTARTYQPHEASGRVVLRARKLDGPRPAGGGRTPLAGVDLEVRSREVLGVAGTNGSGRAELLEVLSGMAPPQVRGEITLEGRAVWFRSPREAIAAGVALVSGDRARLGLFADLSAGENVTIGTLGHFAVLAGLVNRLAEAEAVSAQLARLGPGTLRAGADPSSLTEGERQSCILARALSTRPKVLLLDRPTRGLDTTARSEVFALIRRLVAGGMAVVVASADPSELLAVCDRVLVVREGRVVAELPRAELTGEAIWQAAVGRERTS